MDYYKAASCCCRRPENSSSGMPVHMPANMEQNDFLTAYPLAMAYVPWQSWQKTYPLDQAFMIGTIFPDLDFPFYLDKRRWQR